MFNFATTLIALAVANTALARVYITNPVSTTNAVGGQVLNVKWADDGDSPSVTDIGVSSIDLYTGSVNQQTFLQNLAASVDVSKTSEISATIDPSVGETGPYYFVRFTSANLADSTQPQYKYSAFSAKFEIDNMSGKFNATVLAQLQNDSSASSAAASGSSTGSKAAVSASKSGSASATSSSQSTGAGVATYGTPAAALIAVVGLTSYLVL